MKAIHTDHIVDRQWAVSATTLVNAVNVLGIMFIVFMLLLCAIAPGRIPDVSTVAIRTALTGLLFFSAVRLARVLRSHAESSPRLRSVALAIQTAAVLGLFGHLFGAMEPFQQVLVNGWFDDALLRVEHSLFGMPLELMFRSWESPAMTEWMMFAYMIYVPLVPAMAWIVYRGGGERATQDYLFSMAAVYAVCYAGFVVCPLASPMFHHRSEYPIPLVGWFFTWTSEMLRSNAHFPGGSLPSPHCAAGTVMLVMIYRYQRRWFPLASIVIVSLYISTVYGRFHYVEDAVIGILVAVICLRFTPSIALFLERVPLAIPRRLGFMAKPAVILDSSDQHHS